MSTWPPVPLEGFVSSGSLPVGMDSCARERWRARLQDGLLEVACSLPQGWDPDLSFRVTIITTPFNALHLVALFPSLQLGHHAWELQVQDRTVNLHALEVDASPWPFSPRFTPTEGDLLHIEVAWSSRGKSGWNSSQYFEVRTSTLLDTAHEIYARLRQDGTSVLQAHALALLLSAEELSGSTVAA